MKRFFIAVAILLLNTTPTHAQIIIDGREAVGEGPKGRYTLEQAERIALGYIFDRRGAQVTGTESFWQNGHFYHEIEMRLRDGSIYEVEVNADTGKIHELEVSSLSANPILPQGLITAPQARAAALSHVANKVRGTFKAKITAPPILMVHERKLAYRVGVKKLADEFTLWVDAMDGRIRAMNKE